jgi:hypothetical protein
MNFVNLVVLTRHFVLRLVEMFSPLMQSDEFVKVHPLQGLICYMMKNKAELLSTGNGTVMLFS